MMQYYRYEVGKEVEIRNLDNALVAKIKANGEISIVRRGKETLIRFENPELITVTHMKEHATK